MPHDENASKDPRNPHVHLVSSEFPPVVRGGAGIHVYELHRQLSKVTEVSVTLLKDTLPEESTSIPLPVPRRAARDRIHALPARSFPQDMSGQVVHTHSMAGHIAAMRSGGAYLSSVHSIEADRPWRAARHPGSFERAVEAEMAALSAASTVICVSEAIATDLAKHYGIDHSHVIPPAYDTVGMFHDPGVDALPEDVAWDRPFVLATGRISKQKGYEYLFAAMRRLERPTAFVVRAGSPESPEDLADFRAWLAEVPDRHTVTWLKTGLGRRGMRQLYSSAALHVSPAVYEPFGLANVEALLCGTPVCATAVGGTPEALRETPAILLPDPAEGPSEFVDRLAEVMDSAPCDQQLHERVRASSTRGVLARGDWLQVLPRMLQIYEEATAHA